MKRYCSLILMLTLPTAGPLSAADESTENDAAATEVNSIVVDSEFCRIKLIDDVILASELAGVLDFVEPQEGDSIQKGQQVFGLNAAVPLAAYEVAKAEAQNNVAIRFAEASHEVAVAELEKNKFANRRQPGAIPAIEIQRLELAAKKADLEIEQAEHNHNINQHKMSEAKAQLDAYTIAAPFDGVVTQVFKHKGEAVRQGDPVLQLVSTNRVKVDAKIDIKDVLAVRRGAYVKVELDIPTTSGFRTETFEGRIEFVDVQVDPVNQRDVTVWAEVINRNNVLRAGIKPRMTIYPNREVAAGK